MKQTIQVRIKRHWGNPGTVVGTITRKVWLEAIGNFNPMFCRYLGKHHLVKSLQGDISDPFRREESYLDSLYIEI